MCVTHIHAYAHAITHTQACTQALAHTHAHSHTLECTQAHISFFYFEAGPQYIALPGLELNVHKGGLEPTELNLPLECWDCMFIPPCLPWTLLLKATAGC